MKSSLLLLLTHAVLFSVASPAVPQEASTAPGVEASPGIEPVAEQFHYRWRLGRFLGFVAGIFLPSEGDGTLTVDPKGDGRIRSELMVTSESSRQGEYWRYGADLDVRTSRTVAAWSSYSWHGETSEKRGDLEGEKVMDVASGIYLLRKNTPTRPRSLEIWSDGHVYPVVVLPLGKETLSVAGKPVATTHLSIRGVERSGERFWKGKLDLWFANDARATPVAIVIERRGAAVHLELTSYPPQMP